MSTDTYLKPRLCHLLKWPDFSGYGFNLHAEKGKAGQYIGKVDAGSPAQAAGLKDGDRIVEVNGTNIGNENHQQVVGRIKAGGEETRLLVVDNETDQHYKDEKKVVRGDLTEVVIIDCPSHDTEPAPSQEEVPPSYNDVTEPETMTVTSTHVEEVQTSFTTNTTNTTTSSQFIPRLCQIKKRHDFNGYGFNLHAERDKPGQFIGKIDDDSPALAADLREGDRIVEVNGMNIEQETHQRVIELVKSGGDETRLLVVDKTTDEDYKSKGITIVNTLAEVRHTSSEKEEGHVSAVVETPPVFHIPPPPTDIPPPEEEEEEFNIDEFRDMGVNDEAIEDAVQASQVNEVEAEVPPPEDFPPPQDDSVEIDYQVEQEISADVAETVEAVAVDTETSAAVSEEFTQNTEEITQNSEEFTENTAEIAETLQHVENDVVENDVEVTQAAEAEVEVAEDVQAAVQEEFKETVVTEVAENAVTPQVEEQVEESTINSNIAAVTPQVEEQVEESTTTTTTTTTEVAAEPVEDAASSSLNGQTTTSEPVSTYSPPEPEPEPTPAPAPAPVVQQEQRQEPPKQANGSADMFGGMSAAEMKERLRSRKKVDPRSQNVGFGEKHKMFERL